MYILSSSAELSLNPQDFPRASPSGNLLGLRKSLGRRGWISQYLPCFDGAWIQRPHNCETTSSVCNKFLFCGEQLLTTYVVNLAAPNKRVKATIAAEQGKAQTLSCYPAAIWLDAISYLAPNNRVKTTIAAAQGNAKTLSALLSSCYLARCYQRDSS